MFYRKEQAKSPNGHSRPPLDLEEFDPVPATGESQPGTANHFIPEFGSDSPPAPPAPTARRRQAPAPKNERGKTKTTGGSPAQDSRWRLLLGLGIAVVTFLAALLWLQGSVEGMEVVVASREIAPGQLISAADLTTARLSAGTDYASSLFTSKELSHLTGSNGEARVATRLIRAAEPVMKADLVPTSQYNRSGIPQGQVAFSLPATSANAVSRISRGDLVTLLLTGKGGSGPAAVLAENIRVLEVARSGSSFNLSSGSGSSTAGSSSGALSGLTLLVTLEQARQLSVAREQGAITVVLQPPPPAGTGTVIEGATSSGALPGVTAPATTALPVTNSLPVATATPAGGSR